VICNVDVMSGECRGQTALGAATANRCWEEHNRKREEEVKDAMAR